MLRECSRNDIRHLVHVGDECFVPAGTVLCHEARIGYWFFIVLDGGIRLSQNGKGYATLAAGSHFGEIAILGFGPQPMTATAVVDSAVYVLGRRHVLDLAHAMRGLRHGLFPDVPDAEFQQKIRALRAEAEAEWRRMPRRSAVEPARGELLPSTLRVFPSRRRTAPGSPFAALLAARGAVASSSEQPAAGRRVGPLSRRVVALSAGVAVAAIVLAGILFHPGVLVVRPSGSLEVTGDVTVEGLPVRPPSGRYILTAVSISEPNLFGTIQALLAGEQTLPAAEVDAGPRQRDLAHGEYLESQQDAARLIASRAGVEASDVSVRFRDRKLSGPSAGLVYALLLADVTGQIDVPKGRVVAATGVVDDDGRVLPVGFVAVKSQVAEKAGADLFIVPLAQAPRTCRTRVVDVDTFDDAARAVTGAEGT